VPGLQHLAGRPLRRVERRAKYLLLVFDSGTLILHLGMSGSLRVLPCTTPPGPHDHLDLQFGRQCLRLRDPRRFGAVLWSEGPVAEHELLRHLGPEPLCDDFNADYLYRQARRRRIPVKQLLMDGRVVVGVGNIYATESLFLAGINPARACNRISKARIESLVGQVKGVLARAIEQGGTTLRDFQREDGRPGYFRQELMVYGREGEACARCGITIRARRIGQRTSAWCPHCQR
jgi:formamidopyrimidine-DNA glycosylase